MPLASSLYNRLDRFFECPAVFNLYQALADGGKKRQIRRFLRDVEFESVVDIGCGTGNWAGLAPGRYLGIDTSPSFIAACRRRYAGDPEKEFVEADASTLQIAEQFDLAQMISVLHHLSDDEVRRLVEWVERSARQLFVLDLYPMPWHPVARLLYALDRGRFIRAPEVQKELILRNSGLKLVKEESYFAPTGLYRHTLYLFAT
jgi:SAM-dependent methyltransferase